MCRGAVGTLSFLSVFFQEQGKWVTIVCGTIIVESLQLSCGVSYLVERGGFGMTERTSKAGSVKGVGNF